MLKYLHDENNLSVYLDTEKKSIVKKPKGTVKEVIVDEEINTKEDDPIKEDVLKPPLKNSKKS